MTKTLYLLPHEEISQQVITESPKNNGFFATPKTSLSYKLTNIGICSAVTMGKQIKQEMGRGTQGIVLTPTIGRSQAYKQTAAIIHGVLNLENKELMASHFLDNAQELDILTEPNLLQEQFESLLSYLPDRSRYAVMIASDHLINTLSYYMEDGLGQSLEDLKSDIVGYCSNGFSVTFDGQWHRFRGFEKQEFNNRPTSSIDFKKNIEKFSRSFEGKKSIRELKDFKYQRAQLDMIDPENNSILLREEQEQKRREVQQDIYLKKAQERERMRQYRREDNLPY